MSFFKFSTRILLCFSASETYADQILADGSSYRGDLLPVGRSDIYAANGRWLTVTSFQRHSEGSSNIAALSGSLRVAITKEVFEAIEHRDQPATHSPFLGGSRLRNTRRAQGRTVTRD